MKKLFTNDVFFLIAFLISAISSFAVLMILAVQPGGDFLHYGWLVTAIFFVCELTMFFSYKSHNKNVMKGMIGASLMAIIMQGMYSATVAVNSGIATCAVLYTIVALLLFATHFSINSEHKSRPGSINVNIVFCLIFIFVNVVWYIVNVRAEGFSVVTLLTSLINIGIVLTIVCIEAKLDAFRVNREAAGWTEK